MGNEIYTYLEDYPDEIKLEQYNLKNNLLKDKCKQVMACDFYESIFGSLDISLPLTFMNTKSEQGGYKNISIKEAIKLSENKNNVALPVTTFLCGQKSSQFMDTVYAIAVDADGVYYKELENLIDNNFVQASRPGISVPPPTFIVNSGHGTHLYYVFKEPVPAYSSQVSTINKLYKAMTSYITSDNRVGSKKQSVWIGQPMRVVGSLTKLGTETTAFKYGDRWDINELCDLFKINGKIRTCKDYEDIEQRDTDIDAYRNTLPEFKPDFYHYIVKDIIEYGDYRHWDTSFIALCYIARYAHIELEELATDIIRIDEHFHKKYPQIEREEIPIDKIREYCLYLNQAKNVGKKRLIQWLGFNYDRKNYKTISPRFYEYTLEKCKKKTIKGHRYFSMVAICSIAMKCGIDEERLRTDLTDLAKFYNDRDTELGEPILDEEIRWAMTSYNEKALETSRGKLEEWLGWEFTPSIKRRPIGKRKKQKDHLEEARKIKKFKMDNGMIQLKPYETKTRAKIEQYMIENPTARKCDVIRATGYDKKTVKKYYDEIMDSISRENENK